MKLESTPGYPSQVIANGLLTNFVRNLTPSGQYQIARVKGESDYDVLFQGSTEDCEQRLTDLIEEEYPGLLNQQN